MGKKPLLVIFLTVFIDLVGFGMIIPLGPFFAKEYGASAFVVGLLMSIYSILQFLVAPLWGQLSDRIGRRPVILVSLLGAALSHGLFGWADSLVLLFIARGLAGAFGANISTAMAYIADVTPANERSKGMGLIGAAFGLGFVLGPGIGGLLASFDPSAPAYAAGAICFLNFVTAYFVLAEPERKAGNSQKEKHSNRFSRMLSHIKSPTVGPLILFASLITFALANMEAPLFLFVKDRFGWGLEKASFGFAYVGIVMAFTQGYLIRKLLPKWGERPLMISGAFLFSLGLLLAGLSYSIPVLAIAMTILALGSGFFTPSANGSISMKSDPERQGEVMGVVQSLSALARIFGPPLGGWLYDTYGTGAPFFGGAGLGGLVVLGLLLYKWKDVAPKVEHPKSMTDLMYLGRFQVENIIKNEVPYLFLDLRSEQEKAASDENWIFSKAIWVGPNPEKSSYEQHLQDKDYPVMIYGNT